MSKLLVIKANMLHEHCFKILEWLLKAQGHYRLHKTNRTSQKKFFHIKNHITQCFDSIREVHVQCCDKSTHAVFPPSLKFVIDIGINPILTPIVCRLRWRRTFRFWYWLILRWWWWCTHIILWRYHPRLMRTWPSTTLNFSTSPSQLQCFKCSNVSFICCFGLPRYMSKEAVN